MKRNPNSWCIVCSEGFYCPPSRIATGSGKFCSYKCAGLYKRGRKDPNLSYVPPRKKFAELTYSGKHTRIKKDWGQPAYCENCHTTEAKKFEWANLSREYKEDRSDWARLCTSCHVLYDKGREILCK